MSGEERDVISTKKLHMCVYLISKSISLAKFGREKKIKSRESLI